MSLKTNRGSDQIVNQQNRGKGQFLVCLVSVYCLMVFLSAFENGQIDRAIGCAARYDIQALSNCPKLKFSCVCSIFKTLLFMRKYQWLSKNNARSVNLPCRITIAKLVSQRSEMTDLSCSGSLTGAECASCAARKTPSTCAAPNMQRILSDNFYLIEVRK